MVTERAPSVTPIRVVARTRSAPAGARGSGARGTPLTRVEVNA